MGGNVREWTRSRRDSQPYTVEEEDTNWPEREEVESGSNRVIRGGDWYDSATYVRSAYRHNYYPESRNYYVGFRVVRTVL